VFFLDDDILHEVLFQLLESAEVEGGLFEAGFTEIVVLSVSWLTWELPLALTLFLQFRK